MFGIDWLGWLVALSSALYLTWNLILKEAFDKWLAYKLDLKRQEYGHALSLERDFELKKAEFEAIKLNRALPLLESINRCINEHSMMFDTYIRAILSRGGLPEDFEESRLTQDTELTKLIPEICIYLPKEFRDLIFGIRRVVSCSWHKPRAVSEALYGNGSYKDVTIMAQRIHRDMIECFYSMSNKYLGVVDDGRGYTEILKYYGLDSKVSIINQDPVRLVAWRLILLPEYSGGDKIGDAIERLNKYYDNKKTNK